MVWPILTAVLLWLLLGITFSNLFSDWIASVLTEIGIQSWLDNLGSGWVAHTIQVIVYLLLFLPLVFITALVMTALFAMPALIRLVSERDYPQLKRENGGSSAGSLINVLLGMPIFIAIWLITFPLWFAGVGAILPFIASAYLNQRLFRYDALAEHATLEEMSAIFFIYRTSLWGLGHVNRSGTIYTICECVRACIDRAGIYPFLPGTSGGVAPFAARSIVEGDQLAPVQASGWFFDCLSRH